jgi:hypothetical protein
MRLSWKTLKFVKGFVSAWLPFFYDRLLAQGIETQGEHRGRTGVLSTPSILSIYW